MKRRRVLKWLVITLIILASLALLIICGLLIYNQVGYRPFGSLDEESVETVLFTYEDINFVLKDFEFPDSGMNGRVILPYLKDLRIYFPYEDQHYGYYGGAYIEYTIVMKDGTRHTLGIVGSSDNDIDTGYYFRGNDGTYSLMKRGERSCFIRLDGVLYNIRDSEAYTNLSDCGVDLMRIYERDIK